MRLSILEARVRAGAESHRPCSVCRKGGAARRGCQLCRHAHVATMGIGPYLPRSANAMEPAAAARALGQ